MTTDKRKTHFHQNNSLVNHSDFLSKILPILFPPGIHGVDINLSKEQVVVSTVLPTSRVIELLESTGRRAVLKGQGSNETGE